MTTATTSCPDVRDGLTQLERITVRAVASAAGDHLTRCSRTVANAARRDPHFSEPEIYATLARLAQAWETHYPLISGHGNFGDAGGALPAGSVATRATVAGPGRALLDELDAPEDDSGQRLHMRAAGQILSGPFPNLLANGSTSGDSTFLPHHIGELSAAITARMDDPTVDLSGIRALMPGPDFATPGAVVDDGSLDSIYATGQGTLKMRLDGDDADTTIDVDCTAIVDGLPKRLSLLDQIDEYVEHRRSVLRRKHRSKHEQDLDRAIKADLAMIADQFADDRRTQIIRDPS